MLKTNSKQVKERIDNYILSNFRDYAGNEADGRNILEVKDYIARCFLGEMLGFKGDHTKNLRKQGFRMVEDAFICWCQGLPYVLNCMYYYNISAVDLVGDLLEEKRAERNKYTEAEAEKLMTSLLYRALAVSISKHYAKPIDLEKLNRGE